MPWVGGIYKKSNFATNGWTGDAANNIGIEAGRHDTQDDDFAAGISQCLNKDGSNAVTGNLNFGGSYKITNLTPGTASTDSATYGQVLSAASGAALPTGVIIMYGAAAAPTGYLLCDGAAVSRTSYAALFATIGTAYGVGDGTTTFNVPNFQQRFPLGKAASGTGSTLGSTGGAIDHTHTSAAHSHTVYAHYHNGHNLAVDISHTHSSSSVTGTIGGASDGEHDHDLRQEAGGGGTSVGSAANIIALVGSTVAAYKNSINHYTGGGHSHTFSLTAGAQSLGSTSKTVTGTIGAGSRDGNTDVLTSSETPAATGANNPPYLTVNYIIKH